MVRANNQTMSWDDPSERRSSENDGERVFQELREWVDSMAEQQGSSPEEVAEKLVYSYWIFDELTNVMNEPQQSDGQSPQGRFGENVDTLEGESVDVPDGPSLGRDRDGLRRWLASLLEEQEQRGPTQEQRGPTQEQRGPTQGQSEPTQEQSEPTQEQSEPTQEQPEPTQEQPEPTQEQPEPADEPDVREWIELLVAEVASPSGDASQTEQEQRPPDESADSGENADGTSDMEPAVAEELQELTDTLNEFLEQQETETADQPKTRNIERLADELQGITGSVEQNTARIEKRVHRDDFEELTDFVRAEANRRQELEETVDREFDGIEQAMEELLVFIEETNAEFDQRVSANRSAITRTQEYIETHEQLVALKEDAIERDITRADCESCGESISMAMLSSPECPACSARFSGLGTKSWVPFRSVPLETENESIDLGASDK